jgi:hypothetical protein
MNHPRRCNKHSIYKHAQSEPTHLSIVLFIWQLVSKGFPVTGPVWPTGWVEVQLYSSMTAALEEGEWSAARPGRNLSPGKNRYPFYRRMGGRQGRSGRAENLVPTGIRSRTVQAVAQSLYRLSYRAHMAASFDPKLGSSTGHDTRNWNMYRN